MTPEFDSVVAKMPELLKLLQATPALQRSNLREVPEQGVYVFYENGNPIYVGRSNRVRERLLEHSRRSSQRYSATLAFNLAKEQAPQRGIRIKERSRKELEEDPAFGELFTDAKERVGAMMVRAVEICNQIEQSVFEVYAALTLGTHHDFDTH